MFNLLKLKNNHEECKRLRDVLAGRARALRAGGALLPRDRASRKEGDG